MNVLIYFLSGLIFSLGLSLSGMIDPQKVKGFLSVGFSDWNPALIFVLGSAVPVYLVSFLYLRHKNKTLQGGVFARPASRPIDRKLVFGALLFGAGWGIAGVCPGPALVNLAFLDLNFLVFIGMMIAGFELQRRFA